MNYNIMTENYKKCLKKGLEFQDFVTDVLINEIGISLSTYGSQKYQYTKGENKQGFEIKFDDKYNETGNIYIEIAEKSDPANTEYVKSGIYRNDNTWLYLIGNYDEIYIFGKSTLILMHGQIKNGQPRYKEITIATSKGFLVPKDKAEELCLKKINFLKE